ncbi:MAG: hypothetical protein ACR2RL_21525 [Gammaproteobacteria bacterium]
MRWAVIAVVLLVLPMLQGCAGLEVGTMAARAVQYGGKYCEVRPDIRATIRADANKRLALELGDEAWVFVHCPGDAPTPWRPQ